MTVNYKSAGLDFDDLFDPDIVGDGPGATGYNVAGVPLRYAALQYGTKRANVGYSINGSDVSNLWAAKGTATYTITGLNGRVVNAGETANTSQGTVMATAQVAIKSDGTWELYAGNSKGPITIPAPTGTWLITGGVASDYQVQFDVVQGTNQANVTNGAPAYVSAGTTRSASITLPSISAANASERDDSLTVRIRVRRTSTLQVVSDTNCILNVSTVGFA
jgi:hypothetical protein